MNKNEDVESLPRDWKITLLKNISEDISYGYTASSTGEPVGPKMLRITDIQNNAVNWGDVPYCEIEESAINKYLLMPSDIVFARTGATVGKSFLIPKNIPKSIYASYLIRVRLKENVNPRYIAYFFQSNNYWLQIRKSQAGIGQPNVNGTKLKQLSVPLAPIDEQNRIVNKIEELFTKVDAGTSAIEKAGHLLGVRLETTIARAGALRESILQHAFSGRLASRESK